MELGHELGTWSRESKRSARAERGPEGKCVDTAGGRALAARGGLHRLLHALFGTVPEAHRRETRRGAVCAAQQRGAGRVDVHSTSPDGARAVRSLALRSDSVSALSVRNTVPAG